MLALIKIIIIIILTIKGVSKNLIWISNFSSAGEHAVHEVDNPTQLLQSTDRVENENRLCAIVHNLLLIFTVFLIYPLPKFVIWLVAAEYIFQRLIITGIVFIENYSCQYSLLELEEIYLPIRTFSDSIVASRRRIQHMLINEKLAS